MAQGLVAIANITGGDASLTSTDYPQDNCPIPHGQITHTGGSDDDAIRIPDCSGPEYFADHHISVHVDGGWTVSIWNDDQTGHPLQWSPGATYDGLQTVGGSDQWPEVSLIISVDGSGTPTVTAAPWS